MKAWWQSYGVLLTGIAGLLAALAHLAMNHGLLPATMGKWLGFLDDAAPLVIGFVVTNFGVTIMKSPDNSTTP